MLQNLFLLGLLLLADVHAQSAPNCPAPVQIECLASQAQFTVLGSITETNLQTSTLASQINYNATMALSCVYASFSNPVSNLISGGRSYLTTGWGNPKTVLLDTLC